MLLDKIKQMIQKYLLNRKQWQDRDDVLFTDLQRFEDKLTDDETVELLTALKLEIQNEFKNTTVIEYKPMSNKPSTYLDGTSVMRVADQTDWEAGINSTVVTQKNTLNRVIQYNYSKNPKTGKIVVRGVDENKSDTWGAWAEVATTDSNVVSATKLETARKIAGILFDGTKDIKISASDVDAYSKDEIDKSLAIKKDADYILYVGTDDQWNTLSEEEKNKYTMRGIPK